MKMTIESSVNYDPEDIKRIADTIIPRTQDLKDKIDELPDYIKKGVIYATVMILIGADRKTGKSDEMVAAFDKLIELKEGKKHGKS